MEHFIQADRKAICQENYNLANDIYQKIHLISLMRNMHVSRNLDNPKSKNREASRFNLKNSMQETHRVCLKFFCAIFAISHRVVVNFINNMSEYGLYTGRDNWCSTTKCQSISHYTVSKRAYQFLF
mgnify:CR=1 FL=1